MLNETRYLPKVSSLAVAGALVGLMVSATASAAVLTYSLSNHLDSGTLNETVNTAPPLWGLRLDGLTTDNEHEIYLFDFDDAGSAMFLDYDDVADTVHIYGTSLGGWDADSGLCVAYPCVDIDGNGFRDSTEELWTIDFLYNNVTFIGDDGADVIDTIPNKEVVANHANFGTLTGTTSGTYDLRDHSNGTGQSFVLRDSVTYPGSIGVRGWLDYLFDGDVDCADQFNEPGWCGSDQTQDGGATHPYTSDWLFIATPVPVPAAVWLFGSGLIGLAGVARKGRKA
ncbi:MAG TPA: VPLPA-CTERM sorting domain-containing protein [Chromatiaceae bacterium]|jgi:hypothetical protein|nr:VPLPA-CTERM sorting domain-containing protein [Chromatiaceae bacterium]HIN83225.1 VPLPA-CTERM sorting domain-containing protein [Chromatiales bacterium]HIA08583.1 VPLPA-CTERM sorting domain-containing protein [Chromatiaceae bacterium]HIB83381.1 VPLPA-CTERM sorting domain-containing protein [Chromatiaceae bacterium]HIO14443.1 VPLPA-CTERM sorting domain-containing protein [Chromatiales bacterium]